MARKEKGKGRSERLEALVAAGNHGAARAEARAVLADAGAPEADRATAARILASLRPEPAAALVAVASVVIAIGVAAWTLTRG